MPRSTSRVAYVPWPEEVAAGYRACGYWKGQGLDRILRDRAAASPERPAVVDGARRLTYAELDRAVDERAAGLLDFGLRPGDRVVVQLPNRLEFIELCFALFRIGVAPVMALPGHRHAEIRYFSELTEAKAFFTADLHAGFDHRELARRIESETGARAVIVGDAEELVSYESLRAPARELPAISGDELALLQLSGGSTGTPKLIARTHDDYFYSVRESARAVGLDESSVYLVALPAAHNFPLSSAGSLGCLFAGGTVVLCSSPAPEVAFPLLESEGVTVAALVPPLARVWLDAWASAPPTSSQLRLLQVGGARFDESVARRVQATMGCQLQQVFGMAEGLVNYTRLDDAEDLVCTTQGVPLSEADELRIVDEADREVPPGAPGQLLTRGPYTIRGYFRAPEYDRVAFTEDGFYRTGDVVRQLPSGHLVVVGRVKQQINRGGEKVAPEEIEGHLRAHPSVIDVAVVGVEDAYLGERAVAFVVWRTGGKPERRALSVHLRERGLATFKIPDRFEFRDDLPKTSVGKIDKSLLARSLHRPASS